MTRTIDGIILKPLADLIKEHNGDALLIRVKCNRTERRHHHEELFVENLLRTAANVLECTEQNVPADPKIAGQKNDDRTDRILRKRHTDGKQHHRNPDAPQPLLQLLRHLCHCSQPSFLL